MGIETERFVESTLDKDLAICPVCRDVFDHPVELPDCQHVFCMACLRKWFDTGVKVCPLDRIPVVSKALAPNRALQVVLDRARIRCSFVNRGCQELFGLGNYKDHERICAFNPHPDSRIRSSDGQNFRRASDANDFSRPSGSRRPGRQNPYGDAGHRIGNPRQGRGGGDQQQQEGTTTLMILGILGVVAIVVWSLIRGR